MKIAARSVAVTLAIAALSSSALARAADTDDAENASPKPAAAPVTVKDSEVPITDTREDPNRRYSRG